MAKYATCYDGVLAQLTETFSLVEEGDKLVHPPRATADWWCHGGYGPKSSTAPSLRKLVT